MATLIAVQAARAATPVAMAAASAGGDDFANTKREAVLIDNTGASPITLTIVTQQTVDGEAVNDKQITIPAGEMHLIGPFDKNIYDDSQGKVQLTYSDVTNVSVAVVRVA